MPSSRADFAASRMNSGVTRSPSPYHSGITSLNCCALTARSAMFSVDRSWMSGRMDLRAGCGYSCLKKLITGSVLLIKMDPHLNVQTQSVGCKAETSRLLRTQHLHYEAKWQAANL